MRELVIQNHTKTQLDRLSAKPAHAVLLTGPSGIGKTTLAVYLAELLLELPSGKFQVYPHQQTIRSADNKAIGIETVRDLEHFLSLKIPGKKQIARIVLIEGAQLLTQEAQNALLKTLEEPPNDTVLILTTTNEQALLPTIRSRMQVVKVNKPDIHELEGYFANTKSEALKRALAISGGLPGLTAALLDDSAEHPLVEAVRYARELLQKSTYEKLLMVDELAKRKELSRDVCYILSHMAQLALVKEGNSARWNTIMKAAYKTDEALANSAQPKLVLTNLMLLL